MTNDDENDDEFIKTLDEFKDWLNRSEYIKSYDD